MSNWPCYLQECISPLWKLDEACVEFWKDCSNSSEILTFAQFLQFSDELATVLRTTINNRYSGIGRNCVVAIVWIPHLITSVFVHATLKAGALFYPVVPQSCHDSLKYFENHLIAVICLGDTKKLIESLPDFTPYCSDITSNESGIFQRLDWSLFFRSSDIRLSPVNLPKCSPTPNTMPAYVITTSGSFSTEKKIVCVAHSCLTANIIDLANRFGSCNSNVKPLQSVLLASPLTFDPSIVQIYFSLISHRRLIVPSHTIFVGSTNLTRLCSSAQIDWLQCTPSQFAMVDQQSRSRLLMKPGFHLILGGEPFPLTLFSNLRCIKASINGIYGTTEVSSWATFYSLHTDSKVRCYCGPPCHGATPIGYPMFATNTKLVSTNSANVFELYLSRELGGFSIICLKSSSISDQEFEQAIELLPYAQMWKTGDLVQLGACGKCLWFIGRKDRIVKRFGYQICLERLEHTICSFKIPQLLIRRCRCQILDSNGKDQLVLFLEIKRHQIKKANSYSIYSKNWRQNLKSDLIKRLRKVFHPNPDPWLPSSFVISSHTLPVSSHGKLIYKPLRPRVRSAYIESEILRLWNNASGKTYNCKLAGNATLSELGGTSLSAVIFVETLVHRFPKLYSMKSKVLKNVFTKTFLQFVKLTSKYLRRDKTMKSARLHIQTTPIETTPNNRKFENGYFTDFEYSNRLSIFARGQYTCLNNSYNQHLSITLKWHSVLGKCVDASPVIFSNVDSLSSSVLIGSHSGLFTSLKLSDGQYTWSQSVLDLCGRIEASACCTTNTRLDSNPLVAVGTLNGNLYTIEAERGIISNCYNTMGAVKSAPLFVPEHDLLISGSHGRAVHAYDIRLPSSQPLWSTNLDNSAIVAPISGFQVKEKEVLKFILVPTLGGSLGCFDLRNPVKALWIHHDNVPIFSKSVSFLSHCLDSLTFRVSVDGTVLGLSTLTGNVVWKTCPLSTIGNYSVFSDPVLKYDDKTLTITTNNGFIYALSIIDGQVKWIMDCRFGLGPSDPSSLNTPYLFTTSSSPESSLFAITRADGMIMICSVPQNSLIPQPPNVICTYNLPNQCFSSPVLCPLSDNGDLSLVCGCRDDRVYCFTLS